MDRIEKFVRKLGSSRASEAREIFIKILTDELAGLDVKKLMGRDSTYRVRVGKLRIQFVRTHQGNEIIDIGFRNDNTY